MTAALYAATTSPLNTLVRVLGEIAFTFTTGGYSAASTAKEGYWTLEHTEEGYVFVGHRYGNTLTMLPQPTRRAALRALLAR